MSSGAATEDLRNRYGLRCGYCGVHEYEVGARLEVDHYHPRSVGGTHDTDNLVYCCTFCNRVKADFWPTEEQLQAGQFLLHPLHDDLTAHIREEDDGLLVGLTRTGTFHIERLQLNRAPLVALRQRRGEQRREHADLTHVEERLTQLVRQLAEVEREGRSALGPLARHLESLLSFLHRPGRG